MQPWKVICIGAILCATGAKAQQGVYETRVRAYIEQFKDLAIEEQKRSGIPAAITLAQGIHETSAGNSELATQANNHFGIKCKKEWTGETFAHTDDAPNECFRKYKHFKDSYRDHSDYLKNSPRYAQLFTLSQKDYTSWAAGLKRCGYATNPKYAPMLVKLIEDYHLQDYTYAALSEGYNPVKAAEKDEPQKRTLHAEVIPDEDAPKADTPAVKKANPVKAYVPIKPSSSAIKVDYDNGQTNTNQPAEIPAYGQIVTVNNLRAFYAKKGTSLLKEAVKYDVRYARLLELNDIPDAPLEADMYIYLDRKLTRGLEPLHVVKPGETLMQISQATGLQLRYLRFYNRLTVNEEPVEGSLLRLQEYTDEKPEVYVKNAADADYTSFAGSTTAAVPQGTTRTRAVHKPKQEVSATTAAMPSAAIAPQTSMPTAEPVAVVVPTAVEEKDAPEVASAPAQEPITASLTDIPMPAKEVTPNPVAVKQEAPKEETPIAVDVVKQEAETVVVAEVVKTEAAPTLEPTPVAKVETPVTVPTPEPVVAIKEVPKAETNGTPAAPLAEVKTEEVAAIAPIKEEPKAEAPRFEEEMQPAPVPAQEVAKEEAKVAEPVVAEEEIKPVAVEEKAVPASTPAKEPADEFERLKHRLDKVVYATDKPATANKPVTTDKPAATADKPTAEHTPSPVDRYTVMKTPAAKAETKKETKPAQPTKPAAKEVASADKAYYTLKKGETAFNVAKKHNLTMRQLMALNNLNFDQIKVGQKLRVK